MPPQGSMQTSLSPAELSYIHTSLSSTPPIRPDLRKPTQFRPLVAETDILPATNGSARVCFSDGAEAIVGVKAEVEKGTRRNVLDRSSREAASGTELDDDADAGESGEQSRTGRGDESWVEVTIEIPGFRDDDALPVFLSAMLLEALLASGELKDKLFINERWHWRLYIDILLLSQPLAYPLPLLSLTTYLALRTTHLPRLISDEQDDPLFDDDWAAATPLYPAAPPDANPAPARPPVTLLVMAVGDNILFDPAKEELAVADAVVAVSIGRRPDADGSGALLQLLALRTIDSPARLTPAGVLDSANPNAGGGGGGGTRAGEDEGAVWRPPVGGMRRDLLKRIVKLVLAKGVGDEVLAGLEGVVG